MNEDKCDRNEDERDMNEEDKDKDHMDEDDTSETEIESEDGVDGIEESEVKDLEDEAGKIEVGEDKYWGGSEHRQRMEYGQGAEDYKDEIRDGPNKPVIARAEAWEQPYHVG
jgi:hypothetical protein